ncbi:MAG: biotin--[acetyl-CoA-carboxylase] ligase [Proteobacteria bacterium]|nr:biotin--[acetyl-CoA-carboxylase] ligase [Pseudomonadota bacterium]
MGANPTLIRLLADGEPHAAESLARALGTSSAGLAEALGALAGVGLEPRADEPGEVRLAAPLDLLDEAGILAALGAPARARLERLERFDEIDSTNARLLTDRGLAAGRARVAVAEFQGAGRGRRGRAWLQPYGAGLALSVGWRFAGTPATLGALGLAAGVAVLRALARLGIDGLELKWPNDVLYRGGKLGGILAELRAEEGGAAYVVVGVGLNVRLPPATRRAIVAGGGIPPADLAERPPGRSRLAAALIDELVAALAEFAAHGLGPFLAEWRRADAYKDRRIEVREAERVREGIARGIDADGALLLEVGARTERLSAGEISLRAVA